MAAKSPATADPVALGNQYKQEFETTFEGLRQRTLALQQQVQAQLQAGPAALEPIKQDLLQSVQAQTDVTTPPATVLTTFMWSSVLVLGASIGYLFGGLVLSGLVHLFVGGFAIALLILAGVPAYGYYTITKGGLNDSDLRMFLLALAGGSGLLLGAGHSHLYFNAATEPIGFLTPLIVALVFAYGAKALGHSRTSLLGASVGGAFAVTSVVGILTGGLSVSFLLAAILYAGVAFLTLQFLFKNVTSDAPTHVYMLANLVGYLYVRALAYCLFGTEEKPVFEDK